MVRLGLGEEAAVTINLIRLESVLKNAVATCADPDDRRGALFCANCGWHADNCPCCDDDDLGEEELAERRVPSQRHHRCDLTRALEEVREALKPLKPERRRRAPARAVRQKTVEKPAKS